MGRPSAKIDTETLYDLMQRGLDKTELSETLGISKPTLSRRIADITEKQGLLLKYRELQHIQLTELQCRVLEAITPEKIESASLTELTAAFRILKDKELVSLGKPNEITGLVGYLIQLEKDTLAVSQEIIQEAEYEETEEVCREISEFSSLKEDDLPKL